jgi:hypothetical protein
MHDDPFIPLLEEGIYELELLLLAEEYAKEITIPEPLKGQIDEATDIELRRIAGMLRAAYERSNRAITSYDINRAIRSVKEGMKKEMGWGSEEGEAAEKEKGEVESEVQQELADPDTVKRVFFLLKNMGIPYILPKQSAM